MKNLITILLLVILLPVIAIAQDFEVDGICYNIDQYDYYLSGAIVTYNLNNSYSGDVIIPSTVIYNGKTYTVNGIGKKAFYGCGGLTSVTIPSSVKSIGEYAFGACASLNTLNFNAVYCEDLSYNVYNVENTSSYYGSNITTINIGENVQRIPAGLAYHLMKLKSITIPSSVTSIGNSAFCCCGLTSITIPSSVTSIGNSTFQHCTGLVSVVMGNSVTSIGNSAFMDCDYMTNVIISDSVTSIGDCAFYGCNSLTSITIPKCITSFGKYVFSGCTRIIELHWNAINCSSMGSLYIPNLEHIYIGDEVQMVPGFFASGSKITSISIPNSVNTIGESAFANCNGLTEITIPNSVNTIGKGAFKDCQNLTDITIPNSLTTIATCTFENCSSLTNIVIPNSVSMIGESAFRNCSNLTSLNMGTSLNSINSYAFCNCDGLTDVIIPKSVSIIGEHAFDDCDGLARVILLPSIPPTLKGNSHTFSNNPIIYVTNFSMYENSPYWGNCGGHLKGIYTITSKLTSAEVTSDDIFNLEQLTLFDSDGQISNVYDVHDNFLIIDLMPNTTTNAILTIIYDQDEYEFDDKIISKSLVFSPIFSPTTTQTTLTPTFSVGRDEGLVIDACGVESHSESYSGHIKETTNDSYTIECILSGLTPNCNYSFRPWIQYKGVKFYGNFNTISTSAVELDNNASVTPTSVYLSGNYLSPGDAVVTNSYFSFYGEIMENLYQTGLDPNTTYCYSHTIETTTGNQETGYSFRTPALSMVAQPVKMLTNTKVLFEAQTNMIDEETMVGFEWRRYDAPNEMPSTQVYSPVFGGKIAGTLKNLSENVYYKYRPFYTSNSGKSYYGNWVAFLTADADVEYEPMVYTYNSPMVTQTDATLEGVALQGSDEITEQGFEYWKSGNSNVIKVTATGERMSKKVKGLQSGAKYTFRAFLTAGGETRYGNEVEFVTLSNSLDVNLDGEINIADINAVIDIILTGASSISGDVNGDGEVNIADINYIIDAILSH